MPNTEGWLARFARGFGETLRGPQENDRARPYDRAPKSEPFASNNRGVPRNVPPGVLIDSDGRYVAGGYSFSTVEAAASYAARLARPAMSPSMPPAQAPVDIGRAPAAARKTSAREVPCWVSTPTHLTIGSQSFTVDMVYFGTPLRYEGRHDQSRIDPRQPIDAVGDRWGTTLNYWPSYAGMHPRARYTYLEWLSQGRKSASIPIGFVFVFFYGLEQRLLVDDARDDASSIFAEVRRLLAIYGENYSFRSYASRLLALSCLYEDQADLPATLDCAHNYDLELPLDLRVRLGQRLRDGLPFSGDDALRWVLATPGVYLRTAGQRCFDELRLLWLARFNATHPEGLTVRRPRSVIKHTYRAASGTFSCSVSVGDLLDISGTSAPLTPLRALFDACMEELSAYSRLLGRDPDARGRLRGDLLLPAELRVGRKSLTDCRAALNALTQASDDIPARDLARVLEIEIVPAADKLSAGIVRQMGAALDALGFGYEPDRRYSPATAVCADTRFSVFSFPGGAPVDQERAAYAAARGSVEVAMLAAASDGEVVPVEIEVINRRLRATPDLSDGEVARLQAYGRALAADPPKVRAALKKLSEVPVDTRAALAVSAVEAVLADGRVHPDEVRFLEALHASLNIPAAALYSAIHRGSDDLGPVTIIDGQPEVLVPIPAEPSSSPVVSIDAARLEKIRGETSKVSALLASIFVEDEPEQQPPARSTKAAKAGAFQGLDGAHSELLQKLLAGAMSRQNFETAAASLRLMPDGAIEALNEWGFDHIGEGIVEDDDEIRIVPELIQQIAPMGVAA